MSDTPTTTDRRQIAVETDTRLAEVFEERARAEQRKDRALDELHGAVGDTRQARFSGPWKMTTEEVLEFEAPVPTWEQRAIAEAKAKYAHAVHDIAAAKDEIDALNETWAANGHWHRYFLVNNTNGHVHRDMACSTCYPTTQYVWLVDLADCDEDEMVAQYGEMACTVCFPAAPTYKGFGDGTSSLARYSEAEQAARQAEKDAKAAAKAAKAITQPDGQPLRERSYRTGEPGQGPVIKTERTASVQLTDMLQNVLVFGYATDLYMPQAEYLAAALAHKRGQTVEEVMAEHEAKARKRK